MRARSLWAVVRFPALDGAMGAWAAAPREPDAVTPTVRSRSRRPDAVAVRRSRGRRIGEERVASWHTPQPKSAVRSARACSVGGRPILDGAMSARAARRGDRTRQHSRFEVAAADLMRWPCVRRELAHTTTKVCGAHCARVLHGRSSDSRRGHERTGRAPRGSNAATPAV